MLKNVYRWRNLEVTKPPFSPVLLNCKLENVSNQSCMKYVVISRKFRENSKYIFNGFFNMVNNPQICLISRKNLKLIFNGFS